MDSSQIDRPVRTLLFAFAAWKSLLLLVALCSSLGSAYDTSSTLLQHDLPSSHESVHDLATKLTRWDAIYFIQSARKGYVYEQEWAFGRGLPILIATIAKVLKKAGFNYHDSFDPLIGVAVSHLAHFLSVLALFQLGRRLYNQRTAFVAALLHVLSPAGLFLSAPYQEATFSFLSFTGLFLFSYGCLGKARTIPGDAAIVGSGVILGLATTFRSNGILNGLPFAAHAVAETLSLLKSPNATTLRRLGALGLGGVSIALGSIGPQALAYQIFCSGPSVSQPRPWCNKWVPSIYSYVQERYWNVGFLRYWTPGNIPLFLLAVPMIFLLVRSGWEALVHALDRWQSQKITVQATSEPDLIIVPLALSQLLIAAATVTTYHVQVITRLSSGFPLWYFWLAQKLAEPDTSQTAGKVVIYMVLYATIQGALFASFLPPA